MSKVKRRPGSAGSASDHAFAIALMEHLVVPTFVLSPECKVLIWNRACERLTGVPWHEVVGTSDHWRGYYDTRRPCLADLIAQGRSAEVGELYAEHGEPDAVSGRLSAENWCVMPQLGTSLYLALDAGPIFDGNGRLIAVVETLRDMTAQKEAQIALEKLASRDGLTGLANRRSFDEVFENEWRRAARERQTLSLLMIDIDFFKRYNDAFGHQKGDECLKAVASIIGGEMLRPGDHAARYGGEEFAVVLAHTSAEGARRVAERIRRALASRLLPHPDSPITDHVTISVGVATIASPFAGDQAGLMAAADAALYRAKLQGRDRVVAGQRQPLLAHEAAPFKQSA